MVPDYRRPERRATCPARHATAAAAHGFLRAQGGNEGANLKASQQAWPLTVGWIKKYAS